jgi:hypothetical protein
VEVRYQAHLIESGYEYYIISSNTSIPLFSFHLPLHIPYHMTSLNTIAVLGIELPAASLAKIRAAFTTVHYHPDFVLPVAVRGEVEMILANWRAIPADVQLSELTSLKHIQLSTAGADMCMRVCPAVQELAKVKQEAGQSKEQGVTLGNASGIHVLSIPNWVTGNAIVLYHQLQQFMRNAWVSAGVKGSRGVERRGLRTSEVSQGKKMKNAAQTQTSQVKCPRTAESSRATCSNRNEDR